MDIHRRKGVLEWITRKIVEEIPPENRERIFAFDADLLSEGLAVSTRCMYLSNLYVIAKRLEKPFHSIQKSDISNLLAYIENNGYTTHTKEKFRRTIKKFWKWQGKKSLVKNIRTMSRSELYKLTIPETTLKKHELRCIIASGRNLYEKAILSLLAETGARIGEILALRTKSVEFDKIGARITLPAEGKTGKRVIRVVRCRCNNENLAVNLLSKIIDYNHKFVFHKYNHLTGQDTAPSYQFIRHLFERIRAAKCTTKHVHAHLFRHSAATRISPWLSYSQMCQYFGWQLGSKMPSIYIRCNNVQLDNSLLRGYGMRPVKPERLCLWC